MYQMTLLVRAETLKRAGRLFHRLRSSVHHVHLLNHTVLYLQFAVGKSPLLELRDKALEVSPVGERKPESKRIRKERERNRTTAASCRNLNVKSP